MYTPSTFVAFSKTFAPISLARNAAAVSVEKNGLPVPAAKMTTRPFSRCRTARRRMNGSATERISMADCTRVGVPARSRESWSASALMTVANIPMWSPVARSRPRLLPAMPRKMLPPPMTIANSMPSDLTSAISLAMASQVSGEMPCSRGPSSVSPLSFNITRRYFGCDAVDLRMGASL